MTSFLEQRCGFVDLYLVNSLETTGIQEAVIKLRCRSLWKCVKIRDQENYRKSGNSRYQSFLDLDINLPPHKVKQFNVQCRTKILKVPFDWKFSWIMALERRVNFLNSSLTLYERNPRMCCHQLLPGPTYRSFLNFCLIRVVLTEGRGLYGFNRLLSPFFSSQLMNSNASAYVRFGTNWTRYSTNYTLNS